MKLTKKQFDELSSAIGGFNDWEWCPCSECNAWAGSHAIDIHDSIKKLIEHLKERFLDENQ